MLLLPTATLSPPLPCQPSQHLLTTTSAGREEPTATWNIKAGGAELSCQLLLLTLIPCVRPARCQNSVRIFILSCAAQAQRFPAPRFHLTNFTWQIGESGFFCSDSLLRVNLRSAHLLYIKVAQNSGDEAV